MTQRPNSSKSPAELSAAQATDLIELRARFHASLQAKMELEGQLNASFDLAQVWPDVEVLPAVYEQLTAVKTALDSFRPIAPETIFDMEALWDIQYTYESNRIEGNSLTLDETQHVVEKGLTIGGKPLNDHLEAINHQDAIQYIRELASSAEPLTETQLRTIHSLVLRGIRDRDAGSYRRQPVFVLQADGKRHSFPDSFLIPKLMEDYFLFYNEQRNVMHPVEMAAHLHQRLVNIHPFIDGNGRTARLVMNLHLLKSGYPIAIIDSEMTKRQEYYRILSAYRGVADGDSSPFERFVAAKAKSALFEYLSFLSADQNPEAEGKGYVFFKAVGPYCRPII